MSDCSDLEAGRKAHIESIEIRACEGLDELEACVQLQVETWGYDAGDVIPRRAFLVAQKIGGQVLGRLKRKGGGEREEGGRNKGLRRAGYWNA